MQLHAFLSFKIGTIDISKVLNDIRDMRKNGKSYLQVERNKVLEIGLAYFKQDGCEFSPLEITFTTDGVLEDCIDLGKLLPRVVGNSVGCELETSVNFLTAGFSSQWT